MADLEAKLETLQSEIDRHASDYAKVSELMAQQEQTQQKLDEAMERWMFLQEKWEQIQNQ